VWQLERLEWKQGILNQYAQEMAKDARAIALSADCFRTTQGIDRGFVVGEFLHDKEILIQSQVYEGLVGYNLITPFRIKGTATAILVNRGWVPADYEDSAILRPSGERLEGGLAALPARPNGFTPANDPEKDIWFTINVEEITMAKNLHAVGIEEVLGPKIFLVDGGGGETLPKAQALAPRLNNNHAQYALFWFTMAGVLAVIFVLRFMR
jgi:surfeit locus 1 family protein